MYYFDVLEKLDAKPQTGIIPQLSTDACKSCKDQEGFNKTLIKDKAYVRSSKPITYSNVQIGSNSNDDTVIIAFTQHLPAATRVAAAKTGTTESPSPAFNQEVAVRSVWTGNSWKVDEIGKPAR